MAKLALWGRSIQNSLSPLLHGYSAKKLGIDLSYELWDRSCSKDQILSWAGDGVSVTSPFKSLVGAWFKGYGNTLYREGSWRLADTDGPGFWSALRRYSYAVDHLILLGCGGVVPALLQNPYLKRVDALVRTPRLASFWRGKGSEVPWTVEGLRALLPREQKHCCIVQISTAPDAILDPLGPVLDSWQGAFMDLRYRNPWGKPWIQGWYDDGLSMLVYQGLMAQKLWWKTSLSFDEAYSVLKGFQEAH